MANGGTYGELSPFMRMVDILSSRLSCIPHEDASIVSTFDLSFIQILPKGGKMYLSFELTHNMFKFAYIFSLISFGCGDILAPGKPIKERDTWEGKCEIMELRCYTF